MVVQKYMNKNQSTETSKQSNKRKKYEKPVLIPLGDIRDVTMGGSPGFGDSGAGDPEKPF